MIDHLGRLYDLELNDFDSYTKFQEEVLDKVDIDNVTGTYNTRERLKFLAPACSELIIKCKWGGDDVNCTEIIATRRTNEGYCCSFNYVRQSEEGNFTKAKTSAG
jgi:amiloride-sensitive sodium channel